MQKKKASWRFLHVHRKMEKLELFTLLVKCNMVQYKKIKIIRLHNLVIILEEMKQGLCYMHVHPCS